MAENTNSVKDIKIDKKADKLAKAKAKKTKGPGFFKRIAKFFRDLMSEVKKIVWPSKKQTKNNTLIVLAVVLIAAIIIIALDSVFGLARTFLLSV